MNTHQDYPIKSCKRWDSAHFYIRRGRKAEAEQKHALNSKGRLSPGGLVKMRPIQVGQVWGWGAMVCLGGSGGSTP